MTSPPAPSGSLRPSFHDEGAVLSILRTRTGGQQGYSALRKALFREGVTWEAALARLPEPLAVEVAQLFEWKTTRTKRLEAAADGSTKALFEAPDGQRFEAVLLRQREGRNTLCVSTQIGCALGCAFCSTGRLGLIRDLGAAEILEQATWAVEQLRAEGGRLRNVVFMGMGEPLLNFEALAEALRGLTDQRRFELAPRYLSVSTCGVVGAIERFGREFPKVRLAVSLHAPRQDLRDTLMPGCRRWPLEKLMEALRRYQDNTGHRLFLEYIMIAGVNDSERELAELIALVAGRDAHVNLIPYNPGISGSWSPSARPVLDAFQRALREAGIVSTVRRSAGESIAAACGQLAGLVD
ncbi:MAG: 23S rRNA (adenine(2503)-C(2))-methyltransferase RlmN [Spirochaetales bacterium]